MNTNENQMREQSKRTDENLAKIAISKEADRTLAEILSRVNDGFEAGKATKQEIASYIVMRFFNDCTDTSIHDIRLQFFNPILLMEATLKKAKETGIMPDSVRQMLYDQFIASNGIATPGKKTKKTLKSDLIKDKVENEGEAP